MEVYGRKYYLNIYNADGSITTPGTRRTLTLNGKELSYQGTEQRTYWSANGSMNQSANGGTLGSISIYGGNDTNLFIQQFQNSNASISTTANSTALTIGTHATAVSAPVIINTSAGGGAIATEKMRITGEGNVGVSTNSPTEKLDNSGITRLRGLPLNGATNAIYTQSNGTASATQNQTFTATRTVVADANGVLGYVVGTPTSPGVPKLVVSAGVPGTQNIKGNIPNTVGNYSVEYLDVYNAWTSNVFTVPASQGGVYIVAMQTSHTHTVDASSSWFTIARIQKSTDGGTTWTNVLNDTSSSNLGTDVDNGNKLYWTGALNAGDRIRVVYQCSSIGDNIVSLGSLTITQLNQ
ncbi:hypothetical protein ACFOEQ_12290 [Chryseobacterium arachidis]|uniref:hypothetical protein n=1 Tax=Chryseobacterium arachidis TaxID=1416778 RepID=UPI003612F3E3